MSKFTPKVKPVASRNNSGKNKLVLVSVSIKKILSSIPAKFPKEVNQISKYFKNLKLILVVKFTSKLYAQASKPVSHTEEVIKIKDAFSSLSPNKINQV